MTRLSLFWGTRILGFAKRTGRGKLYLRGIAMNRTRIALALLLMFFLSGCDISWWRYRFEQQDKTANQVQRDHLQCQTRLKEEDKLQYWWDIDQQVEGCMREKGYHYVQAGEIAP
jgi:hypothetical protein